jgi:hypothetical protein
MYKHHEESINNLITYFKKDDHVIAVILGGSIAKGCEKIESDVDAMVIVTEEKYKDLKYKNSISECISGYCTYAGGYFDVKYYTKEFLKAVAVRGSEPARNAFMSARCLYSKDNEIGEILKAIPLYQKNEKADKMLSFYSTLNLNSGYFWDQAKDNIYLRTRVASDVVLFGLRMLLLENEKLFPCHKGLFKAVAELESKPQNIIEKAKLFLQKTDDDTKNDFVNSILSFVEYEPPKDFSSVLTRFIDDNELWWYKDRPVITEW